MSQKEFEQEIALEKKQDQQELKMLMNQMNTTNFPNMPKWSYVEDDEVEDWNNL